MKFHIFTLAGVLAATAAFAQLPRQDRLRAHFRFSGDFTNSIPSALNGMGQFVGFGQDGRGNPLSAGYFNGGSSFVKVPGVSASSGDSITICGFVFPFTDQQHTPVLNIGHSGISGMALFLKKAGTRNPGNHLIVHANGYRENFFDTTVKVVPHRWQHLALVKKADTMAVYLNGQRIGKRYYPIYASSGPFTIGGSEDSYQVWNRTFLGMIDDAMLYNAALSDAEIASIYQQQMGSGGNGLAAVYGKAYVDANRNCMPEAAEVHAFPGSVQINPGNIVIPVDSQGRYVAILDTGHTYTVSPLPSRFLRLDGTCPQTATLSQVGDSILADVGLRGTPCFQLSVNVSSNRRRRCFANHTVVTVRNEGYYPSDTTTLELRLPPSVILKSSDKAFGTTPDGAMLYPVPALPGLTAYRVVLTDSVACIDSLRGQIACTKATIRRASSCAPPANGWDGADLTVSATCRMDTLLFTARNLGRAMSDSTVYRFYANDGVVSIGKLKLGANDSTRFRVLDDGLTLWRMEVEQTHGHPTQALASVIWGGCRLLSLPTDSLRLTTPLPDDAPAVDEECLAIIDSYDPNDKLVMPSGLGASHIVVPKTLLEYKVRFQNEGTAETEFVRISDTLSPSLDVSTLERGLESHNGADFTVSKSATGHTVLTWRWPVLHLQPKAVNDLASQGFVSFRIRPFETVALGTRVENKAGIYFDYNPVVLTNTSSVTVDNLPNSLTHDPGTVVILSAKAQRHSAFAVYPNPARRFVNISLDKPGAATATLSDVLGNKVRHYSAFHGKTQLSLTGLRPGTYFLAVTTHEGRSVRKVVVE